MRSLRMPVLAAGLLAVALGATQANAGQGRPREYVVVYEEGASAGAAHAAIEDAGGQIVSENADIGVATVRSRTAASPTRPRPSRRSWAPRPTSRSEWHRSPASRPSTTRSSGSSAIAASVTATV